MQSVVEAAPRLIDFLGEESLAHFNAVKAILDANGVAWTVNPRLVRGMDYYNLTVFEWVTDRLGAQGTVCGGGRYDGLIEQLGGKPAPAVGWGLGMERLLLLLEEVGAAPTAPVPDAYAVVLAGAPMATVLHALEGLRAHGVCVQLHPQGKDGPTSAKSQFKKADASGALFALVSARRTCGRPGHRQAPSRRRRATAAAPDRHGRLGERACSRVRVIIPAPRPNTNHQPTRSHGHVRLGSTGTA